MNILTGIIVYLLVYVVMLFCVLPWGNKPIGTTDSGKAVASAPINPRLKRKFLITGVLALLVWGVIYTLTDMNLADFHSMAREMHEEDMR